ncbi:hypothetical protein EAE91_07080 [Photorhabdus noenieputensis]|uniref:hypothetical protein n=1 Tax=Photorhabdus noenieputensis TaxID=1208607 RepID=UPI001BD2AC2F|nr:hypothetical protein [Photorhabdus noenieputensis]MBS9436942.1 hypothetical protein [Photorhabdus noenieputensis]MCK3667209.1 hypothetical protein [Photorhabdus noenieputensis]
MAAITLVAINPDFAPSNKNTFGFPIVDMNQWELSEGNHFSYCFIDEFNCVIKVDIYQEAIRLIIKEKYKLSSWVKCSHSLWLGLDDEGNIISVLIK